MDWPEALDIVVARTKCERRRVLCADDHPDREINRQRVVEMATGQAPEYPPLWRQATNLAGSIGQVVVAAARGVPILADPGAVQERRKICLGCEFNGKAAEGGIRCTKCGCGEIKMELAALRCPVGKW